ncbi:MAG: MucR family transcriptional regulator [Planctomycetota bacterium]
MPQTTHDSYDHLTCQICGKQLKALTIHLDKVHDMSAEEYKEEFNVDHVICRASRETISQQLTTKGLFKYVPRDKQEMIRAIKVYAKEQRPLLSSWLFNHDQCLYHQATYVLGSWNEVLAAAELGYSGKQYWSEEDILSRIKERLSRGMPVDTITIRKTEPQLYSAASRYLKGWKAALERAGYDAETIRTKKRRTRNELAGELRAWVRKHGFLNSTKLETTRCGLLRATLRLFGSVRNAAKKLRLDYQEGHVTWTAERVLQGIRKRAGRGKPLNYVAVVRDENKLKVHAEKLLGSWERAVELAIGRDYSRICLHKRWSRDAVVQAIRARHRAGKSVRHNKVRVDGEQLFQAALRYFGCWRKALKAAMVAENER